MDGREFDGFPLFDRERSACLCDVGAPGHTVAISVIDNGCDTLWIADDTEVYTEHTRCGKGDQPHEQIGPLPRSLVDPIRRGGRDVAHTCADFNKRGQRSKLPAASLGDRCQFHRDKASAQ